MVVQKPRISVIGAGKCSENTYKVAFETGKLLAKSGFTVVCGGLYGVMEAVAKGAFLEGGETIGILPGKNLTDANKYITHPIVTGIGEMRNFLVVLNGELVIAIDGGAGTLSEIAIALKLGKKVIAINSWKEISGVIFVSSPNEAMKRVLTYVGEGQNV